MRLISRNQSTFAPLVSILPVEIPTSYTDGSPSDATHHNVSTRTISAGRTEYDVITNATSYENLSPTTLDLSDWPRIKAVESPAATSGDILFTKSGTSVRYSFYVANTSNTQTIANSIISGSKLEFFHDLVWAAATAASKDGFAFRAISGATPTAVTGANIATLQRNPNCWAAAWNWTGCPIKNSRYNGPQYGGVMITERHLLEAWHVPCPVGTTWTFMDASGTLHTRTSIGVNSRASVGDWLEVVESNEIPNDMNVHVLDSPLPAGITHYPIVGPWAIEIISEGAPNSTYPWRKNIERKTPLAGLFLDQTRSARWFGSHTQDCLSEGYSITDATYEGSDYSVITELIGMNSARANEPLGDIVMANAYYRTGISGDSGHPLFAPLSGSSMALMCCFSIPGGGSYPQEARINALIASADTDAIARGNLVEATGLTVTVAPDPTI